MNQYNTSSNIPYTDLYIYYLKGRVEEHATFFGEAFLGNWEEDGVSFFFFSCPSDNEVEAFLQMYPAVTLVDYYHMSYEEWLGGSLEPFHAGQFYIHPPWAESNASTTKKNKPIDILLDPGVVFGTGRHATTRDCLEAIELAFSKDRIESAIDLGTGTGLLAVAAAKLGCKTVLAVDVNFLAVKTAFRNIYLNSVDAEILAIRSSAEYFLDNDADLVIANIHYDVMKRLLSSKGFFGRKYFVLSGLMRSQARDVIGALSTHQGIDILETWEYDGIWHTYLGRVG